TQRQQRRTTDHKLRSHRDREDAGMKGEGKREEQVELAGQRTHCQQVRGKRSEVKVRMECVRGSAVSDKQKYQFTVDCGWQRSSSSAYMASVLASCSLPIVALGAGRDEFYV